MTRTPRAILAMTTTATLALTLGLAGCNDAIDATKEADDAEELVNDDGTLDLIEELGQRIYATSQEVGPEDLVYFERADGTVFVATQEGKGGQGGFFFVGELYDDTTLNVEQGFGAASDTTAFHVKEEKDGYAIETPHGEFRTVTSQNFGAIEGGLNSIGGQWYTSNGTLFTITPTEISGIESSVGETSLSTVDGTCNATGSINDSGTGDDANVWNITKSLEGGGPCSFDDYTMNGIHTGFAFVTAPNGVSDPKRELVLMTRTYDTVSNETAVMLRFAR